MLSACLVLCASVALESGGHHQGLFDPPIHRGQEVKNRGQSPLTQDGCRLSIDSRTVKGLSQRPTKVPGFGKTVLLRSSEVLSREGGYFLPPDQAAARKHRGQADFRTCKRRLEACFLGPTK